MISLLFSTRILVLMGIAPSEPLNISCPHLEHSGPQSPATQSTASSNSSVPLSPYLHQPQSGRFYLKLQFQQTVLQGQLKVELPQSAEIRRSWIDLAQSAVVYHGYRQFPRPRRNRLYHQSVRVQRSRVINIWFLITQLLWFCAHFVPELSFDSAIRL